MASNGIKHPGAIQAHKGRARRTMTRMKAATLEHAQSRMRLENQTQAKIEESGLAISDVMTVDEEAWLWMHG